MPPLSPLWIIVSFLYIICSAQPLNVFRPSFITVKSGERISLSCPFGDNHRTESVIWYKQSFGEMPQKIGGRLAYKEVTLSPEFKTSGFKMEMTDYGILLKIPHIIIDHSGLYYCLKSFTLENVTLSNGTFLAVTDDEDVKVSVSQSSGLDSVPAGASVTLQCSVLSESRAAELQVLWFRAAPPQSHPQIIYTHHNSSHQCESGSSTHTCVYNFSKNILSLNDTGTYYCAVAACGKIIFGNGTQVQLKSVDAVVIYLGVGLGVCVVAIFVQTVSFYKWKKQNQITKRETLKRQTNNLDHDSVEPNYAALHFKEKKIKSGIKNSRQSQDTVYSEVRSLTIT
ncbi:uncharacterized protein Hap1MRO34_012365 [Clarias gariepinus]|uniref:uncharacterized protein LOC128531698 n=1 Tax=Clarias gariepinus TaxID=13013 RepID=UPI00234D20F1|nr:uncharacterized protein LOC128531698 [Clarias gariepinus]